MIRQIVIINSSLKMSKGKVARVCLMLGIKSNNLISNLRWIGWTLNGHKAAILKADGNEFKKCIETIKKSTNHYCIHIDTGLTQVPAGSECGIVFFTNDDELFKHLKLYWKNEKRKEY